MSGTLFLMRHGQIEQANPRRFIGQRDLPLEPEGRDQARGVGERLRGVRFERAVCSGLQRTRQTAELVLGHTDQTIEADPRLNEIHLGEWEGLTVDEVRERFPDEYEARGKDMANVRPKGGESFLDLQRRVVPCLMEVAEQARGNVLVVAHSGVNRAIICHLLGMNLSDLLLFGQEYCCLNLIRTGQPRVLDCLNQVLWRDPS